MEYTPVRFKATLHGQVIGWYDTAAEAEAAIDAEAAGEERTRIGNILDQWEPAPEWAKAAKRVDAQSVNNTTRTGPDGCLPALS